ncbi:hypothetical protein PLICRDRAFT_636545 [Plicaturopsis crispa FD-325 SS-3]|nr:hypothetical protein PLICRDRAFT_636545 [Plicaturopsis crispa FD-325 SS-3]
MCAHGGTRLLVVVTRVFCSHNSSTIIAAVIVPLRLKYGATSFKFRPLKILSGPHLAHSHHSPATAPALVSIVLHNSFPFSVRSRLVCPLLLVFGPPPLLYPRYILRQATTNAAASDRTCSPLGAPPLGKKYVNPFAQP